VSTQLRASSYYSRLLVPVVLRAIFGRREIVRSLGTAAYSDACIKARVWERRLALLFTFLKEHHQRMTSKEIEGLIDHYLSSTLHSCEEDRATREVSDDEREAISLTLSDLLEKSHGELRTTTGASRRPLMTFWTPTSTPSREIQKSTSGSVEDCCRRNSGSFASSRNDGTVITPPRSLWLVAQVQRTLIRFR
jgi:hypothetical protein